MSLARRDWPAEIGQQTGQLSGGGQTFSDSYASSGSDVSNVIKEILKKSIRPGFVRS